MATGTEPPCDPPEVSRAFQQEEMDRDSTRKYECKSLRSLTRRIPTPFRFHLLLFQIWTTLPTSSESLALLHLMLTSCLFPKTQNSFLYPPHLYCDNNALNITYYPSPELAILVTHGCPGGATVEESFEQVSH